MSEFSEEESNNVEFPFHTKDVVVSIFENTAPLEIRTYGMLFFIPSEENELGALVFTNLTLQVLDQRVFKNRNNMIRQYHRVKGKVVTKEQSKLVYEGRMLYDTIYNRPFR